MVNTLQIKKRIKQHDQNGTYWPDAFPECTPADITTPHEREELGGGDIEKGNQLVWDVINSVNSVSDY